MTWTEAKSNCTLLGPSVRSALQSAQISSQRVQDKAWIGAYRGHTPWLSVRGRTCMLQTMVRQMRLYVIRQLLFGPQIRLKVGVFEDFVEWRNFQIVWTYVFVWYQRIWVGRPLTSVNDFLNISIQSSIFLIWVQIVLKLSESHLTPVISLSDDEGTGWRPWCRRQDDVQFSFPSPPTV